MTGDGKGDTDGVDVMEEEPVVDAVPVTVGRLERVLVEVAFEVREGVSDTLADPEDVVEGEAELVAVLDSVLAGVIVPAGVTVGSDVGAAVEDGVRVVETVGRRDSRVRTCAGERTAPYRVISSTAPAKKVPTLALQPTVSPLASSTVLSTVLDSVASTSPFT